MPMVSLFRPGKGIDVDVGGPCVELGVGVIDGAAVRVGDGGKV